MFTVLISFFLIMSGGVFFKIKKPGGIEPDAARHVINTVVLNFFLPALCFKVIAEAPVDRNTLLLPVSAALTVFVLLIFSFAVFGIIGKFVRLENKQKGVLVIASAFSNVTFLGLPLLTGLYGGQAAQYVLIYDLLAVTPLVWFAGASIASYYGKGEKLSVKESIKNLAALAPIWALILGFAANFTQTRMPVFLVKTLDLMSMPIAPLMIFSVGLALAVPETKEALLLIAALVIKLCIAPLTAYCIAAGLGMDGLPFKIGIMEAALPTMVLTLVLASKYKLDHKLAAMTVAAATAVSFITVPAVFFLAGGH